MLSLANVYPCVLPFAFFACKQLPSCLTDIPGRFHKSHPQKAINNAWADGNSSSAVCIISPLGLSQLTMHLFWLPPNHQTATNSQAYTTLSHSTDSSYQLQEVDSSPLNRAQTANGCVNFMICSHHSQIMKTFDNKSMATAIYVMIT
jgi:hypothetical protein